MKTLTIEERHDPQGSEKIVVVDGGSMGITIGSVDGIRVIGVSYSQIPELIEILKSVSADMMPPKPSFIPFESIAEIPVEWWNGWLKDKTYKQYARIVSIQGSGFQVSSTDRLGGLIDAKYLFDHYDYCTHPGAPLQVFGKQVK